MNLKVIDSHSHIGYETDEEIVGKNIMMPYLATINEYEQLSKNNNIYKSLLSPCTSPMIVDKINHKTKVFYLWKFVNGKFDYYNEVVDNGKIILGNIEINPYREINEKLEQYLKKLNSPINIEFIPAVSLYFDTPEYIEKLLDSQVKGLKIHGVSSGIYDLNRINNDILKLISKYDIPLVIHTDYTESVRTPIDYLYHENNPLNWIKLLDRYKIRGYLVHGCRLSKECGKILKANKGQFLTGISPDILLNNEPERLMSKTDNYLESLFELFDIDTLAFDLDYNWNFTDRITYTYDDNQIIRFNELKLNNDEKIKVLRKNSERFFRM